jgi:hydroxymethylglutaryl-CoA lyase
MADTASVLSSMPIKSGVSYPVLVPNARGLEDLLSLLSKQDSTQPPLTDEIAIFTAATESFTKRNTNVSIAESLDRLAKVTEQALARGLKVRGYISVVAGCPYEGDVDPKVVGDISKNLFDMGCYEVSLGDTVGVGHPASMLAVLEACARYNPPALHAAHCHDTFGTGLANVLAMVNAGVKTVDAAVGGLGGCPYSPGATGNIDTESVIYALHQEGYETGFDLMKTAEAGEWIARAVGKENNSRAGRALLAKARQAQAQSQQAKL